MIRVRVGNMKMRDFHGFITRVWPQATTLIETHKLVILHASTIEFIA